MTTATTTALDDLKTHDGKAHLGGLPAYVASRGRARMQDQSGAYSRRRAATCAITGETKAAYDARAEARVDWLLTVYPTVAAEPMGRALVFGFVSHELLAEARKP